MKRPGQPISDRQEELPMRCHLLHAVLFEDRGWWVAQCLEHNLTASSKDPQDLHKKLENVLRVQMDFSRKNRRQEEPAPV